MKNFYSHPGKLIKEHIKEIARHKVPEHIKNRFRNIEEIYKLIAITHDFGKYTTYFQDKVTGKKDWGAYSHHSLISGLFFFWLATKYFKNKWSEDKILAGVYIILHHHDNLTSFDEFFKTGIKDKLTNSYVINQIDDIINNQKYIKPEIEDLIKKYFKIKISIDFVLFKKFIETEEVIEELKGYYGRFKWNNKNSEEKIEFFFFLFYLFSFFIFHDKAEAGGYIKFPAVSIPSDIVNNYLRDKERNNTNKIRQEIQDVVCDNIKRVDINKTKIFTITAPTGGGKTLTGFKAALILRERVKENLGYLPKIIYALPFINIINQNYEVLKGVLEKAKIIKSEEEIKYIVAHHHLTEIPGDKDEQISENNFLIEGWESNIIITTFYQLFHTIFGNRNSMLKKFHQIIGSILILDEIQNIPVKYWKLIRQYFLWISEKFNTYIILMSATQPAIFDKKDNVVELLKNNKKYFNIFNRTAINTKRILTPVGLKDSIKIFKNFIEKHRDGSVLIILNTIDSSLFVFNKLKEEYGDMVYYLSTNKIPLHRGETLREIKKRLLKGDKVILVCTQVIEAGVDVDFDIVIRDIAPIDSIIQASGRCNRENKKAKRENVYLVLLKYDNRNEYFGRKIYGAIKIDESEKILSKKNIIEEKEFNRIINKYFTGIKQRMAIEDASNEIIKIIENLDFEGFSDFALIEDKINLLTVFIEFDEKAKTIWERYCEIKQKEFIKRRIEFLKIKKEFYNYIINLPITMLAGEEYNLPPKESEFFYRAPLEDINSYYDKETGYKRRIGVEGWII